MKKKQNPIEPFKGRELQRRVAKRILKAQKDRKGVRLSAEEVLALWMFLSWHLSDLADDSI